MREHCPTPAELEAFLLGHTADADALEHHLADCQRCAARLIAAPAEDAMVAGMRAASPVLPCAADPAVGALMARLRLLPNGDTPAPQVTLDTFHDFEPPTLLDEIGRLGPYRIIRELGRGGMGVVYLAWHEPLKRQVAVKVLAADPTLNRDRLARFRREAEIIASLQHPNVVQVYEVGERGGRPFFAMEYVAGGTLAERLIERPLSASASAELVATLARAVQAAHEQGVVHRDLKPANVLLTKSFSADSAEDTDFKKEGHLSSVLKSVSSAKSAEKCLPKIADFGLAKSLDTTLDTYSGAVLGTPGYLAPEQLSGHELGPAADVYSLGAILYECLTGRPPFKAATVLATLDQARTRDPLPPGRLQPGLPRDLQTICLKCLEREPHRRYASAAALANDLRSFRDGRPIAARPVSASERAGKWARRRPAAAGLIAATVAFLAVLIGGSFVYQAKLRDEVRRATAATARADAQYRDARQALQAILDRTRKRAATGIPKLKELEREHLENALTFFLRSAEQAGDDPEVRADVALAALEAGKLQTELGRTDDASANLERARDGLAALAAEFPDRLQYRARLAYSWAALGNVATNSDTAARCARESLARYDALVAAAPDVAEYRSGQATAHHNLGSLAYNAGRFSEAADEYSASAAIRAALVASNPDDLQQRGLLAQTHMTLSITYQVLKRGREMVEAHDLAEAAFEELLRRLPGDERLTRDLAILRVNWAYTQHAEGRTDEALADTAKNFALLKPLLEREPNAAGLRHALFSTHGVRANIFDQLGRRAESVAAWRGVVEWSLPEKKNLQRIFLATALAAAGDHAAAFAEVEALADLPEMADGVRQYRLVQICCNATKAASGDVAERYATRAVALFAKLCSTPDAATWREEARADATLVPLLERADFRKLVPPLPD